MESREEGGCLGPTMMASWIHEPVFGALVCLVSSRVFPPLSSEGEFVLRHGLLERVEPLLSSALPDNLFVSDPFCLVAAFEFCVGRKMVQMRRSASSTGEMIASSHHHT